MTCLHSIDAPHRGRRTAPGAGFARRLMPALAVLVLTAAAAASAEARGARADILELEDRDRASLMKEQMKQRRVNGGRAPAATNLPNDKCGSVEIGNDAPSRPGSQRIAERERTVIITGNVYNTATCR